MGTANLISNILLGFVIVVLIIVSIITAVFYRSFSECKNSVSPYCHDYVTPSGKVPVRRKESKICSKLPVPPCAGLGIS